MTEIICRASDCAFWDDGLCSSDKIVYDPDQGCLTYEPLETNVDEDEEWVDDEPVDDEVDDDLSWEDELEEEFSDDDEESEDW